MWRIIVKTRSNMRLKSGKYMWSHDVVVIANKKVKFDYISSGNWEFDMNGVLDLLKEKVNESTISQLASWGVSFGNNWYDRCLKRILGMLQWDLTFGSIGICMVCTSISPFFLCAQSICKLRKSLQESLVHALTFFFQGPAKT